MAALDPVYTIGEQIAETIVQHEGCDNRTAMKRALGLLEQVKIPSAERRLKNFPHEMSGGMRQRAMIALALACKPSCAAGRRTDDRAGRDGADPDSVAAASVAGGTGHGDCLRHPRCRRRGRDLRPHRRDVCRPFYRDRNDTAGDAQPMHPYTQGLLSSTVHGGMRGRALETIPGSPPNLADLPPGCPFAPRCRYAMDACRRGDIPVVTTEAGAMARCVRAAELVGA